MTQSTDSRSWEQGVLSESEVGIKDPSCYSHTTFPLALVPISFLVLTHIKVERTLFLQQYKNYGRNTEVETHRIVKLSLIIACADFMVTKRE